MDLPSLTLVSVCFSLYLGGKTFAADICQPGELYTLGHDPCQTCVCGDNYLPTDKCTTTPCTPPTCPDGTVLVYDAEECCEYYCITVVKECIPGLRFSPPELGCAGCDCDGGYRNNCVPYMAKCAMPECAPGEVRKRTPGECCGFYCTVLGAKNPWCNFPIHRGCPVGHTYMKRWGYNTQTGRCELYVAGNCRGQMHENSFSTQQICEQECSGFDYESTEPSKVGTESKLPVILGGVAGAVVLVTLVVLGMVFYCRKRQGKKQGEKQQQEVKPVKV